MAAQYPPYQRNNHNVGSEASFDQHAQAYNDNNYANDSSANLNGAEKAGGVGAGGFKGANMASSSSNGSRSNKKWWIGGGLLALVVVGAVLGGVLGTQLNKDTQGTAASRDAAVKVVATGTTTDPNGKVETLSSTSTSSSSSASSSTASARPSVSALPEWKWTQTAYTAAQSSNGNSEPMYGAALGNWLLLEAWMDEPWFNASASNDAAVVDEWTLMQKLGDNARSVMTEHYETWITEDDIEKIHQAGMNHIRIPVGFWAFIDCADGEPYLCNFNQTAYIDRALSWAYSRGMYAIIDLHGLPGSHNGEVTSGHLTRNPTFFQDANQQRSRETVKAALEYITTSPYRSVVSALQVINEPRPYTQGQFDMLRAYYQDAYEQTMALSSPVPIIFHHGYPDQVLNTPYTTYWRSFAEGKDPNYLAMSTHPYIGTFPLSTNSEYMLGAVCSTTQNLAAFPLPVLVTEWSVQTGIKTSDFERQLYVSELVNFAMVGGSIFWNIKAVNGNVNNGDNSQWSFLTLLDRGSVPTPSNGQSLMQFLESLGQPCGSTTSVTWASSGSSTKMKSRRAAKHRVRQ